MTVFLVHDLHRSRCGVGVGRQTLLQVIHTVRAVLKQGSNFFRTRQWPNETYWCQFVEQSQVTDNRTNQKTTTGLKKTRPLSVWLKHSEGSLLARPIVATANARKKAMQRIGTELVLLFGK